MGKITTAPDVLKNLTSRRGGFKGQVTKLIKKVNPYMKKEKPLDLADLQSLCSRLEAYVVKIEPLITKFAATLLMKLSAISIMKNRLRI